MRELLKITNQIELYTISIQPGEIIQDFSLYVAELLVTGETVSSALVDDETFVPSVSCEGKAVKIDIIGPANGVQAPVRLTLMGSMGSQRHVALVIVGSDPFVTMASQTPNIYLRWRGGYRDVDVYLPYDLVMYGGVIYLALRGSRGATPNINLVDWMAWAATGGGEDGGGSLIPDSGGSGRYAAFKLTWIGPEVDDWQVEVKGVTQ